MRLSNTELPGNMGAGSWLELDGLKTLNTETCRTTAAADRPLDTAVIYTGTVYTRVVYTPADYTAADCMEVGQTRGGCHGRRDAAPAGGCREDHRCRVDVRGRCGG